LVIVAGSLGIEGAMSMPWRTMRILEGSTP
jgi:hypothetical protein